MSQTTEQIDEIARDPGVRKAVEAARELEPLKESAPWLYLRRRFEEYPEKVADTLARRLLRGDDIDQREIDFCRGYAAAIEGILTTPERVTEELERAAEKAYKRLQQKQETSAEHPPYE